MRELHPCLLAQNLKKNDIYNPWKTISTPREQEASRLIPKGDGPPTQLS